MNTIPTEQLPEIERAKRLIRKLLDRTADRGCSESEAMEASEKVGALLQQFDLELTDVVMREEVCRKIEVFTDDDTLYGVITGIARLCSLKSYHVGGSTPPTYVLFGFERDILLAEYLWEVINEAQHEEWARFTKVHGFARKKRDSFRMGFGTRVHKRLVALREQRDREAAERAAASSSRDLVLVRDHLVEEEFARTGVKLVAGNKRVVHDNRAFHEGSAAGGRVQIHTPVNGDKRSMLS